MSAKLCASGMNRESAPTPFCSPATAQFEDASANCAVAGEQNGVGADSLFIPLAQSFADIQHAAAIIAGDDRCHTLHEIGFVAFAIWIGEIAQRVCVRIDESGSNYQSRRVDRARGSRVFFARVA